MPRSAPRASATHSGAPAPASRTGLRAGTTNARGARLQGPSTRAVHGGEAADATGAVNPPVVHAATFWYPELPDGSPSQHIYSRQNNPTVQAVEAKLAALEGCDRALLFGSGMAAMSAACGQLLRPGDTVAVQRGGYGGTPTYMIDELAPMGVKVQPFDAFSDGDLPEGTRLVWIESLTNPLVRVTDVPAWARRARKAGAALAVDATFATPLLQRPLEMGAQVTMHSATKYLGGHSDLLAGALCVNGDIGEHLWRRRRNLGGILDPHAAFLLGRGMKTLALRVQRHNDNALAVANALDGEPGLRVHYPGLRHHADHDVAKRVLTGGFGGIVTVDVGSLGAARAFRRALRLVIPATSLGSVESLACLPIESSHAYWTPKARAADGVTDGLVRISIGIEDPDDIVEDLRGALAAARKATRAGPEVAAKVGRTRQSAPGRARGKAAASRDVGRKARARP